MGIVNIPRWVGPVVTPILLIIFLAIFCCYYCYWKPKKRKRNAKKPSKVGHLSESKTVPCQVKYLDEGYFYSYSSPMDCPYGPYYTDVCRVPTSNTVAYCKPEEYRAEKIFYFKKTTPNKGAVDDTVRSCKKQSCPVTSIKLKQNSKMKCKKGHCLKSPNLPIIAEGDSIMEEEESEISRFLGNEQMKCKCNGSCSKSHVVEIETESDSNGSGEGTAVGHDSGYED